jgi:hypothetical protein
MLDEDRKELEDSVHKAAAAIEAKDELEGKKAQNVIENKMMGSGLASLMFIAERVMTRANAKQARLLAQSIAALRAAYAQGPDEHFDKLVQNVRLVVADIINQKIDSVPTVGDTDRPDILRS